MGLRFSKSENVVSIRKVIEASGSRSISRVLSWAAIHLEYLSPDISSNLPGSDAGHIFRIPIWSCSRWGLPCHFCCQKRGAPLPHHFTLTSEKSEGGIFSVALAVDSHRPGVTWHPALWSPDFPQYPIGYCDCLADSQAQCYHRSAG